MFHHVGPMWASCDHSRLISQRVCLSVEVIDMPVSHNVEAMWPLFVTVVSLSPTGFACNRWGLRTYSS
jgi:hypothetical protein